MALHDVMRGLVLSMALAMTIIAASLGGPLAAGLAISCSILILMLLAAMALRGSNSDFSFFLIVPIALSAFQNVYLAPVADRIDPSALQILITMNWLYSIALYVTLRTMCPIQPSQPHRKSVQRVEILMLSMITYGILVSILFNTNPTAAVASARNITSPFLFFLLGAYTSPLCDFRRFLRLLLTLGSLSLLVGFVEFFSPNFWQTLGLHDLWEKKGIAVTRGSNLPQNFYASEQIVSGEFLRRMAGPFADPVNFGTFLFILFMAAWFMRAHILSILTLVAIALTVSKGALLGLLTFSVAWCSKYRSTFETFLASLCVGFAALYFYGFTQRSSTGSTAAHIDGFLASLFELPAHPFGRGFGGTGVLSRLFSEEGTDQTSAILESGIGMVLGQLGILGAATYIAFFWIVARSIARCRDARTTVLGLGALAAFVLNAAFNEVALSPNSSAAYFIILGLIAGLSSGDERSAAAQSTLAPVAHKLPRFP